MHCESPLGTNSQRHKPYMPNWTPMIMIDMSSWPQPPGHRPPLAGHGSPELLSHIKQPGSCRPRTLLVSSGDAPSHKGYIPTSHVSCSDARVDFLFLIKPTFDTTCPEPCKAWMITHMMACTKYLQLNLNLNSNISNSRSNSTLNQTLGNRMASVSGISQNSTIYITILLIVIYILLYSPHHASRDRP